MNIEKAFRSSIEKFRMAYNGAVGPLPEPEKWVFIVGCYGSGTTLVNKLLATHPMVGSLPTEGQFLTDQLETPRNYGLSRQWALQPELFCLDENSLDNRRAMKIKRQWGCSFNDPARPVLVEKSVPNMARIRWLAKYFAPARFVAILRSPYAVAESIRRKKSNALEDCARQWLKSNEIMLRDLEHVENKYIMHYEQFTENPNEIWKEVLDFIGIDGSESDISGLRWQIHGRDSQITNMNARYLESLSTEDLAIIEKHTDPLLSQLGYKIETLTR
jgi:hypothetical protein